MTMKQISSKAYRIQILTLLPSFISVFMIGCTYGWTPNVILFFQQGNEVTATPSEWSLLASSTELGHLMLAIPSGILMDNYGRKYTIIGAGLLITICWLSLSTTSSISVILLTRFLLGICTALEDATTLASIGEIASPAIRAELIGIYHVFFNSGKLFQSIISISFSSYFVISYCSLAISCTFFISLFWVLETPYYLISVSKIQEARTNLEYLRPEHTENEINFEFNRMQTYIMGEKQEKQLLNWIQFLKSKSIRKPLITCVLISFFTIFTGTRLINAFMSLIIPENDIIPSKYYPLIAQLASFVLSLVAPIYVEKFSRRTLFLMGAATVCTTNLLLALTEYCYMKLHNDIFRVIFLITICLQILMANGLVQPMNSTMKSELFPQSVKGLGSSFCAVVESLASIILLQSYNIVTTNWGRYWVFIILAVNALILCLLIYFRLPEARGRFLVDLQMHSDELVHSYELITTSIKT